ncbi:MAG: ECF transporter S component [Candidatus Thorarchaeota archaeon]
MNSTLYMALVAIFTALVMVATVVVSIPFPTSTGYLNFGDTLVMTSGFLLGPVGGFLAGGIGSAMADVSLGYTHFAPITLLVKGTEGMIVGFFSRRSATASRITATDAMGLFLAAVTMLLGYFTYETLLFGYQVALAELLTINILQVSVGALVASLIGPTLRTYVRSILIGEMSGEQ